MAQVNNRFFSNKRKAAAPLTDDQKAKKRKEFTVQLYDKSNANDSSGTVSGNYACVDSWTIGEGGMTFLETKDKSGNVCHKLTFNGKTMMKGVHVDVKDAGMIKTCPLFAVSAMVSGCGTDFKKSGAKVGDGKYKFLVNLGFGFPTAKKLTEANPEIPERQAKTRHLCEETMKEEFLKYLNSKDHIFSVAKDKICDVFDGSKRKEAADMKVTFAKLEKAKVPDLEEQKAALLAAFEEKYSKTKRDEVISEGLRRTVHFPFKTVELVKDDGTVISYSTLDIKTRSVVALDEKDLPVEEPVEIKERLDQDPTDERALKIRKLYQTRQFITPMNVDDKFGKPINNGLLKAPFHAGATVIAKIAFVIYEDSDISYGISAFVNKITVLEDGEMTKRDDTNDAEEYYAAELLREAKEKDEADAKLKAEQELKDREKDDADAKLKAQAALKGKLSENQDFLIIMLRELPAPVDVMDLVQRAQDTLTKAQIVAVLEELIVLGIARKNGEIGPYRLLA